MNELGGVNVGKKSSINQIWVALETMVNILSGPFMVNLLNRNHWSGVWLGVDVRMCTKKTCV